MRTRRTQLTLAISAILLLFLSYLGTAQPRLNISFNDQWQFEGTTVAGGTIKEMVSVPHTWNAKDAQMGVKYYRGKGVYTKNFAVDQSWQGKRVFIRFEGVNITAEVKVNGKELGTHKGGYAAFSFELTDHLLYGENNEIKVIVSNEENLEVIPLVGDFNNYGGIYRPVELIVTDPICITPLDYASPGVYISQSNVSEQEG